MFIQSTCGVDIGDLIRSINSNEDIPKNYRYDGWTIAHAIALSNRKDLIDRFINDSNIDEEADKPDCIWFKTPRTILEHLSSFNK